MIQILTFFALIFTLVYFIMKLFFSLKLNFIFPIQKFFFMLLIIIILEHFFSNCILFKIHIFLNLIFMLYFLFFIRIHIFVLLIFINYSLFYLEFNFVIIIFLNLKIQTVA